MKTLQKKLNAFESIILKFMKTFQKKLNAFESIIVAFIIFIAIFLFLSIPAFFNYESIKDELKKKNL